MPPQRLTFTLPRTKLVGATSDMIATTLILFMLFKTVAYVYRRKRGETGPSSLRPLIHFWVCHAFIEISARLLAVWLAPLKMPCIASLFRCTLLAIFVFASRRFLQFVYSQIAREALAPVEPGIEALLRATRERLVEFREWLALASDELITRYNVGGIASVVDAFRGDNAPRQPVTIAPSQATDVVDKVRRSVVVCAKPDEPKAAYSDSRKLRESFRKRAAAARKQAETNNR